MAYALFSLAALGLLIVHNWGGPAAVYLHYTLNPFIYGVSQFKVNFFLTYFLLLAILAVWPWGLGPGWIVARLKLTLFGLVGAALAAGWLSFILFIGRFSLPMERYVYYFSGRFNSINYFAHIHTSKAVIYDWLRLLRLSALADHYDTGRVFAGYVPLWLAAVLSLAVIGSFMLFLLLLKPTLEAWRGKRPFAVFVIYAFAGAHILKCLVDGGVFSYDLFPSLIALHLLFTSDSAAALADNFRQRRRLYLLISLLYLCLCAVISVTEGFMQVPFGFVFTSSFFTFLFLFLVPSPMVVFTSSLCVLFMAVYWSMHGLNAINSLSQTINNGDRVFLYDYEDQAKPQRAVEKTAQSLGRPALDAYLRFRETPMRNRHVAIIRSKSAGYTGMIAAVKIVRSRGGVKFDPTDLIRIESVRQFPGYGERAYLMKIAFNPALTPTLWSRWTTEQDEANKYAALFLLNDYFRRRGIDEYALIPFYFFKVGRL